MSIAAGSAAGPMQTPGGVATAQSPVSQGQGPWTSGHIRGKIAASCLVGPGTEPPHPSKLSDLKMPREKEVVISKAGRAYFAKEPQSSVPQGFVERENIACFLSFVSSFHSLQACSKYISQKSGYKMTRRRNPASKAERTLGIRVGWESSRGSAMR